MYRKDKKEEYYSRLAREEGYPARSVYKLKEIDEKYKIFRRGDLVLDLGCAPGSWMMYISRTIGSEGRVIGVDIEDLKMPLAANMRFVKKDIIELGLDDFSEFNKGFDIVVSDSAPKTTGVKTADVVNSVILANKALALAKLVLRPGGKFVCKIFEGELAEEFFEEVKKSFEFVKRFRPKAVSKGSREFYVVGMGFFGSR
jgi:23S rRNA (uridine2552-2'-O)-methyltransferase